MVLGVHVSVVFLRILASFRVIFWQPGWNVSHFNYLKVNMAWKIISAYLKGLSKYRKMAFFVLEILVIFVCTLPRYSGYHCKIDRFLHMRTSIFWRRIGGVLQLPGVPHLHVNRPLISSRSGRRRANIPAHAQSIHCWHSYSEQSSLSISNETPKSCIDGTSLTEETWKRSNKFWFFKYSLF